jgi:hypothetical protein
MENRFESLLVALADAHVEFVVAGGVACVLQGVERVTLDLDLSLNFSASDVRKFLDVMQEFGLTPRAPVPASLLADPELRAAMVKEKHAIVFTFQDANDPLWHVDVFLRKELCYDRLYSCSESFDLDGREIRVLTRQGLIELKLAVVPPRPKDQLDIAELRRLIRETEA